MPSPWVTRALRNELPPKELAVYRGLGSSSAPALDSHPMQGAPDRVTLALRDISEPYQPEPTTSDPADSAGTVRVLRAFGIAR